MPRAAQRQAGYVSQSSTDYVRPQNQRAAALLREDFRNMTMADIERMAENMPWGTPKEVAERIIAQAEAAGANMVQIAFNRGAMPQDMFLNQIRRVGRDVLPILQAHEITRVPAAEEIAVVEAFQPVGSTYSSARERRCVDREPGHPLLGESM